MPCSVSQEEQDHYEREGNRKLYGKADLSSRITETVACELSKLIVKHGLQDQVSKMASIWIGEHNKKDAKRNASKES